jgi:choline kinase
MRAVVLAGGLGTRLNARSERLIPKPTFQLLGRKLADWTLLGLARAGIDEAVMVVGFKADEVMDAFGDGERLGLRIRYVGNPHYRKPLAHSPLAARDAIRPDETFVLVMADHVFDPSIIADFVAAPHRPGTCTLVVDRSREIVADLDDAAKVKTDPADPTRMVLNRKVLADYDCVDTGLFKCTPVLFPALEQAIAADEPSISAATERLGAEGRMFVWDVGGRKWADVDTHADLGAVEAKMADVLGPLGR